MNLGWSLVTVTLMLWSIEAVISVAEGTFLRRQRRRLHMAFVWNWAIMYGDLIIFPIINYLVAGYLLKSLGLVWCLVLGLASFFISWFFHKSWWKKDENLGHVFADWEKSGGDSRLWMIDLTLAGLMHFIYMTFQIFILTLYLISPVDKQIVLWVGLLFVVFLVIVNLQAKFIQGSCRLSWMIGQFAGLILITGVKYYFSF